VRLQPSDNCAGIVNRSPNGTTFLFAPGLYRGLSLAAKPGDSFIGDSPTPGAVVLSGAVVIEASEAVPGGPDGRFVAGRNR
jgi:hypothetical protein